MIIQGMKRTIVLQTSDGMLSLVEDTMTYSHSLGLRTTDGVDWKHISEELYDLMIKELGE